MSTSFPIPSALLYSGPSEAALKLHYVGRNIKDVDAHAAILDVAVTRRNCETMLGTTSLLGVGFRAHVKTHKTTQLTRLQVGEDSKFVKVVVSTLAEAEQLLPFLQECQSQGKEVNMLYGLPAPLSSIRRLGVLSRLLGPSSVSVLVDHPDTLDELSDLPNGVWPGKISLFVKVDTGYHRSGASPESKQLRDVLRKIQQRHSSFELVGFYSHMGSSYAASSSAEAVNYLTLETERLADAADVATNLYSFDGDARRITLSLGATPTATAAQNLFDETPEMAEAMQRFERVKGRYNVELHAGVYPVLDLQQLATRARPAYSNHGFPYLSRENLALRVLVEVASLYPERGKPEALIAAGGLALGREPCKSYPGWAVVSGWTADGASKTGPVYDIEDDKADKTGWIVGRISQEHGILTWEGPQENMRQLKIGEKLLLWPNHACIAGAGFGWYFVVDSDTNDSDIIRDVWLRWRGW